MLLRNLVGLYFSFVSRSNVNKALTLFLIMCVQPAPMLYAEDKLAGEPERSQSDTVSSAEQQLNFKVQLDGVEDAALGSILDRTVEQSIESRRRPESIGALQRQFRSHVTALQSRLRAEGYYAADVQYKIKDDADPVGVEIDVETGPLYTLKSISLLYFGPDSTHPDLPRTADAVDVQIDVPARSDYVLKSQEQLLRRLAETGFPFAVVDDREVLIDHSDKSMVVTLQISAGPQVRFGELLISGLSTVDPGYIRDFTGWTQGEIFNQSQVDDFNRELNSTQLFDTINIDIAESDYLEGKVPISVELIEGKHRTVGLSADWSTDEGPGGEVLWEHRNIFGSQELFSVGLRLKDTRKRLNLHFRKPRFQHPDQALLASAFVSDENTDAYEGPITHIEIGLERSFENKWRLTPDLWVENSRLDDFQGERKIDLVGFSLITERDTSDDRLNPGTGSRLRLSLSPYQGSGDSDISVFETIINASVYYPVTQDGRLILAARTKLGAISVDDSADLPANRRFYAGGGSSVRGYSLQSIGPRNAEGIPLGGRSVFELGAEVRVKTTETLGGVAFIEGGGVYEDENPDLMDQMRWAAGFGFRYFTAVGPIRFDFGFPLDRREQDDNFQFYISVGQAF